MALDAFMKKFAISEKGETINYTKLEIKNWACLEINIIFQIHTSMIHHKAYKHFVFDQNKEAYLTEKQLDIGKILIDLDFRYGSEVEEKQHTKDHIMDFVELCVNGISDTFQNVKDKKKIEFYIFEKDHVNFCDDITKDGIHIVINIECDYAIKMIFRDYLLNNIDDIWGEDTFPLKNSWKEVIDEGVMKGHCNWQLYGSRKPGHESYKLKYIFEATVETVDDDDCIDINEVDVKFIDFDKYFPYFCARNRSNTINLRLNESNKEIYERYRNELLNRKKNNKSLKIKKKIRTNCTSFGRNQ